MAQGDAGLLGMIDPEGEIARDPQTGSAADTWVDERDLPRGYEHLSDDDTATSWAKPAGGPDRALAVARSLPTRPAAGTIIDAGTITMTTADKATRVGLEPSAIQAQTIAYLMLRVDGSIDVAGARDALAPRRARFGAGGGDWVVLPHVGGLWVFTPTADAIVSWLVVGGIE